MGIVIIIFRVGIPSRSKENGVPSRTVETYGLKNKSDRRAYMLSEHE